MSSRSTSRGIDIEDGSVVQGHPVSDQMTASTRHTRCDLATWTKRFISVVAFIGLCILFSSIKTLEPEDQILVHGYSGKTVVNGPGVVVINPFLKNEWRKAEVLGPLHYALIDNHLTGDPHVAAGPKLWFLGAYDKLIKVAMKVVLKQDGYIKLVDGVTGAVRVLVGPKTIVPWPTETSPDGPQLGVSLTKYESTVIHDTASGAMRVVVGEALVFPGPFEVLDPKKSGIRLSQHEWVRIIDNANGRLRVERGETIVFLNATESVMGKPVNEAVDVDTDSSVLVLSKETGQQRLVTDQGVFFPGPYEEIIEVRQLIHVEPHEAVVIRDSSGQLHVKSGSDGQTNGTAFFLPPYHEFVEMMWSKHSADSEEALKVPVTKVDMRERYEFFNYEVRTSDNVNLRLEGTIFWKVTDMPRMIRATSDPSGDVWHHARSCLIQAVSKVDLATFMSGFNGIVMAAFKEQEWDGFYLERGVEVHSMELTRYKCTDDKTAAVLQEIIQETTNRINRLQAQESENEVRAAKLAADVLLEKQRTELIQTQAENNRLESELAGKAIGMKLANSAATFIGGPLKDSLPDVNNRLDLYKLHQELSSKNEDTKSLSMGNAHLFLTPQDMNLKLQMGSEGRRLGVAEL